MNLKPYPTIAPEHLAFKDININQAIEAVEFEIMVGNSSRDRDLNKIILTVVYKE